MPGPRWDPGRTRGSSRLHALARLIRVEHTLFSLPFAYAGAALSGARLTVSEAILIGAALFGLRAAAMAYNNIADYDIDSLNPRTRGRPLVAGLVTHREAWGIVVGGSLLYYASAALLNRYALLLSPLLWLLAMSYPHAKRMHWLPHIHLGLVLGFAVFGGAVGAAGSQASSISALLARIPWLYIAAVALWVAGFDIVYSIMDEEFDREHGLGSVPARFGSQAALRWSLAFEASASSLLVVGALLYKPPAGLASLASALAASAVMLYSVSLAWRGRIAESFNLNLAVGILASVGILVDYALWLIHNASPS